MRIGAYRKRNPDGRRQAERRPPGDLPQFGPGFAIQPNYVVDGRVVGSSQAGGFTACELTPGTHEVAVANMALSSNLFGGSEKVSVNLRAGGTTYLSASPQMGIVTPGQITLIEVTENQGRADVASLRQANSCAKA